MPVLYICGTACTGDIRLEYTVSEDTTLCSTENIFDFNIVGQDSILVIVLYCIVNSFFMFSFLPYFIFDSSNLNWKKFGFLKYILSE